MSLSADIHSSGLNHSYDHMIISLRMFSGEVYLMTDSPAASRAQVAVRHRALRGRHLPEVDVEERAAPYGCLLGVRPV